MMLRFSLSADVLPPAYVGRMSRPISSITVSSWVYLLTGRPFADGNPPSGGGATIDPVAAAILVADGGGGVPCDSAASAAVKDRGVSGLLGAIGVPGPELLDSMMTSSSWITVTRLLMLDYCNVLQSVKHTSTIDYLSFFHNLLCQLHFTLNSFWIMGMAEDRLAVREFQFNYFC